MQSLTQFSSSLSTVWDRLHIHSYRKLQAADSVFPARARFNDYKSNVEVLWNEYSRTASSSHATTSLKLATLLHYLMRKHRIWKALDLGGGFSTLAMLDSAKSAMDGKTVVSVVDGDEHAVEKAERLHKQFDSEAAAVWHWDSLLRVSGNQKFDLVYLHARDNERSERYVDHLFGLTKAKGIVIIDDVSDRNFRKRLIEACDLRQFHLYNLSGLVGDTKGDWPVALPIT